MSARLKAALDRVGGRRPLERVDIAVTAPTRSRPVDAPGIEIESLSVRFGGLTAVDGISFAAPLGRITGLIGPNGAGKTSTFDACSGLNRRYRGSVRIHGEPVDSASPAARARLGVGRTFQRMQLCETLSVLENVVLGREAAQAGQSARRQIAASCSERHEAEAAAWSALDSCGITHLAGEQAGALSTGQRRLVELARCLAGTFDVFLLDEPSSGLDHGETTRFGNLLQRIVAERGVGILLVEHDMELVMRVCEHIYVLDFGRMIFDGSPTEVASSPVVRSAYLGSEEVMTAEVMQ
jgi:ABC-type branched-subunit amino acid transport system ATPase component